MPTDSDWGITKGDLGLGVLYHATPTVNAEDILSRGLTSLPVWLAYAREVAIKSAQDHSGYSGSITLFSVNLPNNWKLERAETGVYLSHKVIPVRFIKFIENKREGIISVLRPNTPREGPPLPQALEIKWPWR